MAKIHQEIVFSAPPGRVYREIVDAAQFSKATGAPTVGNAAEGAAFSAFGGHITGRPRAVPDKLIVQAWRAKTWPAGSYSISRFELRPEGDKTRLVFDHDAFPEDQKEHLAKGWQELLGADPQVPRLRQEIADRRPDVFDRRCKEGLVAECGHCRPLLTKVCASFSSATHRGLAPVTAICSFVSLPSPGRNTHHRR